MSDAVDAAEAPVRSAPKELPHIPLEVLQEIASHIDLPSALSLSLTCKALRDAGECKLWETVDVTTGYDPESEDGTLFIPSTDAYKARAAIVDSKLRHAVSAFKSYPFRIECVRTLRIEPSDGDAVRARAPDLILDLMETVADRIRRLDFVPLPHDSSMPEEYEHDKMVKLLNDHPVEYPQLTHLKFAYEAEGTDTLPPWIMGLENLEEIEYLYSDQAYGQPPSEEIERKPLLGLKRITFSHLMADDSVEDDPTQATLSKLLSLAPNLEFLRLSGEWHPKRKDALLKEIAKLEKLKTIVLTRGDDADSEAFVSMDYEGGIDFQHLGKAEMGFEEAVVQNLGWDEMHELRFESLRLPKAAKLERLTVLTTPRLPLDEYISLGIAPTPAKTSHLSLFFFQYILRNPRLHTLLFLFIENPFPSTYDAHYVEPEYFVPPSRWEEEGHRGATIRQYVTHAQGEETFWHIRALSRSLDHKSGMAYVGARRAWQDFTHYKGRTVPRSILEQVYEKAGLEVQSTDVGRDLELGEGSAAWDVLREWRETAGDESEVDDDYTDEDVEGSEMDTEDEDDGDISDGEGWGGQALADNVDDGDGWEDTDDDGEYDEESDDPLSMW